MVQTMPEYAEWFASEDISDAYEGMMIAMKDASFLTCVPPIQLKWSDFTETRNLIFLEKKRSEAAAKIQRWWIEYSPAEDTIQQAVQHLLDSDNRDNAGTEPDTDPTAYKQWKMTDTVIQMPPDGHCAYRAVRIAIKGDEQA